MAISDISLTAGMKSNLISLQNTAKLLDRTQERLSTGKRVNSVSDDPVNFFAAKDLMSRASDLSALKDAMGEAVQTIEAANHGIDSITGLIEAGKGLAQAARAGDADARAALADQFDALLKQINYIANDSGYKGVNFLRNSSLDVDFDENGNSSITIEGFDARYHQDLNIDTAVNTWTTDGDIDAAVDGLNVALGTLRTEAAALSTNLSVISVRQDFTTNMINTLTTGADNLTLADTNEEGANMLMLQTRQQLGLTALSLSAEAAQSVLSLFR